MEDKWDVFLRHYNSVVESCVPLQRTSPPGTKPKPKWMTGKVLNMIREKEKAWIRYRQKRTMTRYANYCRKRNDATREVKEAKYSYEKSLSAEVKTNLRAFYAYARSKTRIREEVFQLKHPDGSLTSTLHEACTLLNSEFQKVFTKESGNSIPELPSAQGEELRSCSFTVEDVMKMISSLKAESAPGPDGVHPTVLKECAMVLAYPLFMIYKASLAMGELPLDWNRANVSPIFKKGNRIDPMNYRPVSLTSVPCKIMEKILRREIVEHLEKHNLLQNYQHGFR